MHEDEPAIGVVLGGAGLAGHIGAYAVAAANGATRALVNHATQHVQQLIVFFSIPGLLGFGFGKFGQYITVAVFNACDQLRRNELAVIGQATIGVDHLQQCHRTGT